MSTSNEPRLHAAKALLIEVIMNKVGEEESGLIEMVRGEADGTVSWMVRKDGRALDVGDYSYTISDEDTISFEEGGYCLLETSLENIPLNDLAMLAVEGRAPRFWDEDMEEVVKAWAGTAPVNNPKL